MMNVIDLVLPTEKQVVSLDKIHFTTENKEALNQLVKEFRYVEIFKKYKLPITHKLLLFGHTGCGKTTTAKAIAKALNKKILILNLSAIISSKLGETARNLSALFKRAEREMAVLFIDEFDYVGKKRIDDNKDSAEMKRLVNAIIQLMDNMLETTLLIAATNHLNTIDEALIRRFQLKLEYKPPNHQELDFFYHTMLKQFPAKFTKFERIYDISYAEAEDLAYRKIKNSIMALEEKNIQNNDG